MELESKEILGLNISKERNMFVAEHFLSDIVEEYMENIQFQQMEVHGILKLVSS
jgi:hypothetical protein